MGVFGRFREKVYVRPECAVKCAKGDQLTYAPRFGYVLTQPAAQVSEVGAPSHFKATTNERIHLMYKEAADFAKRLDKCARQVKAVETATTGALVFGANVNLNIADMCTAA